METNESVSRGEGDAQGRILIVDDDPEIRDLVGAYLRKNGYATEEAGDGGAMRRVLAATTVDLIVLDLMLPGEDGLALCRDLRTRSTVPVLMLTARGDDYDRILGLEMGADDYLAKPFVPRELLARIRSILRRARGALGGPRAAPPRTLRFAGWTLDTAARHLVASDGVVVSLSGAEYRLLMVFLEHPHRVLSRDQLLDLTRGGDTDVFDRTVDLQVSRLRARLRDEARAPRIIKTVRSEGYVLAADVTAAGRDGPRPESRAGAR